MFEIDVKIIQYNHSLETDTLYYPFGVSSINKKHNFIFFDEAIG